MDELARRRPRVPMPADSTPPTDATQSALMRLGEPVLLARRALHWTQAALAEKAGVSRMAVSRIETGKPVETWAFARVLDALNLGVTRKS